MTPRHTRTFGAVTLAAATLLSACGSSDESTATTAAETSATTSESTASSDSTAASATDSTDTASTGTSAAGSDATDATDTSDAGAADAGEKYDLASVCPEKLVIQTDWFPEAEHGSLYEMFGDDYTYDPEQQVTVGPLVAGPDRTDTGIQLEVRAGGPAIGYAPPRAQIYTDDTIHFAYANTDAQAQSWEQNPLIALVAPLEINPQIIMWDTEEHPDVKTLADIGKQNLTINLFTTEGFAEAFVAQGLWNKDQLDPSYDGTPARFVADRTITQQGFASNEPFFYEHLPEYGKAPGYQLIHDAGWEIYSQFLGIRPDQLEPLTPCLKKFIPIVQQATVDFSTDPSRTLKLIVDISAQTDGWTYDADLAQYGADSMTKLGLAGNGPDNTAGNIDLARWQGVLDQMKEAKMDIPADLKAEDMVNNDFIDPSIGF